MPKMNPLGRLLSRRSFNMSPALMALLWPVLRRRDALGGTGAPRKLLLLFSPNGPMFAAGPASGSTTGFTFHPWWSPLEQVRNDGIFLSNMACTGANFVPGPGVDNGLATGHGLGAQSFCGYGTLDDGYASAGPSIDQLIAKRLVKDGTAGPFSYAVWGLAETSGFGGGFWSATARTIKAVMDPQQAWTQVFRNFMPAPVTQADKDRAMADLLRRQSVLDFAKADCAAVQNALGREGVRLLDEHCTTLRQMEKSIGQTLNPSAACTVPKSPGSINWTDPENIDAQMDAFIDLIAMTLACERTRVIGFQFAESSARNELARSYGVPSSGTTNAGDSGPNHHAWTHNDMFQPVTQKALQIFTTFYAAKTAKLISKLKTTNDSSGNPLLDSTMVVCLSELGGVDGSRYAHLTASVPVMVFGSGQGTFKTGRYIKGPTVGINDSNMEAIVAGRQVGQILVSAMQYMGLTDVNTVGVTKCNGPFMPLYG